MRVVYSVATRLNGGGIGTTAFKAVEGIYKANSLEKVYCSSAARSSLPNDLVFSTHTSVLERLKFLSSRHRWLLKDLLHDLVTATALGNHKLHPIDIFHFWNGHGLSSLRRARQLGAKIVVERASSHPLTYEGIMDREYASRGLPPYKLLAVNKKRLLTELLEADFITVPSDFAYQSMIENAVPEGKLAKIPFGVDLQKFQPNKIGHDTFNVLFVGQVGFRKGVLYLLEAWKKLGLKEAKLRILGQEDSEIRSFLALYRQNPSIEFLGYGPSLELYQKSDLFVLPSLEEGSALVSYEALACGLPVLTTFESGSVVVDGVEGYLVGAGKVEALAERIEYFYHNPQIRAEMSQRARVRALDYSWPKYGEKLGQLYERIF